VGGNGYGAGRGHAIRVTVHVKTVSEANSRDHWAKKAKRVRKQRGDTFLMLRASGYSPLLLPPCVVTLTRIAPRKLDSDNNVGAMKACRDGVADWLKVDDGNPLVRYEYAQEKGKQFAVRIEVRSV
jgi:hypothetical protein